MTTQRPDLIFEEFEQVLAGAFLPYQCTFKPLDHGSGFSFAITNNGQGVLEVSHSHQRRITDKRARSAISEARKHLFSSGHKLRLDRPAFRRHLGAILYGNRGGVYEWQALNG